jgi:hypothetical protein
LPFIFVFGIPSATRQYQNASEKRQTNLGSRRSHAPFSAGAPSFPWQLLQLTSVLTSPLLLECGVDLLRSHFEPYALAQHNVGGLQHKRSQKLETFSTLHAQRNSHRQECSCCPVKNSSHPTMQSLPPPKSRSLRGFDVQCLWHKLCILSWRAG